MSRIMYIIIRRFFEMFFLCVILSSGITLLGITDFLPTDSLCLASATIGVLIFVLINMNLLKHCYFEVDDEAVYYFSNIIAYSLLVLLSLCIYFFASNYVFTWMFQMTKFLKYTNVGFTSFTSMLVFHAIGYIIIWPFMIKITQFRMERAKKKFEKFVQSNQQK